MLVIARQAYELLALEHTCTLLLLLLFFQVLYFFQSCQHSFNCKHVTAGDQVVEKRQL